MVQQNMIQQGNALDTALPLTVAITHSLNK
jgi:hypothetical protein